MHRRYRWIVAISLVLVIGIISAGWWVGWPGSRQDSKPTIRIGYQQLSLYQHVFIAAGKGYFTKENLNVELVPFASANQIMTALITGDIDVTGLTNMEVAMRVQAQELNRFKFVNFVVWEDNAFPDFVLDCTTDKDLSTVSQLAGHRLGRHPGSAVGGFVKALLSQYQVPLREVSVVELDPKLMRDAVVGHQVDALYAMDPTATLLVRQGLCDVLLPDPLGHVIEPPIPISGTLISQRLFERDPATTNALVRAFDGAIAYSRMPGTEAEIAELVSKYTSIPIDVTQNLNPTRYWMSSEIKPAIVQRLADHFVQLGIVDRDVNVEMFIINQSVGTY